MRKNNTHGRNGRHELQDATALVVNFLHDECEFGEVECLFCKTPDIQLDWIYLEDLTLGPSS